MHLYLLDPKDECDPVRPWCNEFVAANTCAGCKSLNHTLRETGVDVRVANQPGRGAVGGIAWPSVGIARDGFLDLFDDEVTRHLRLGRVLSASGDPIDGYATFLGSRPLPIRGGVKSTHRECPQCGRFCYCPVGSWYVTSDAVSGQGVYEAVGGWLVLREDMFQRIDRMKWRGFRVGKLPVRDDPLDQIERFPENYY